MAVNTRCSVRGTLSSFPTTLIEPLGSLDLKDEGQLDIDALLDGSLFDLKASGGSGPVSRPYGC